MKYDSAIIPPTDGFALFDIDSRIVAYNQKYADIYHDTKGVINVGARFEDILKLKINKGLVLDAVGREENWMQERFTQFHEASNTFQQPMADGSIFKSSNFRTEDGMTIILKVDITELVKAKEIAEAANEAKTKFISILSHELRSPLTVVLAMSQFNRNIKVIDAAKELISALDKDHIDPHQTKEKALALLVYIEKNGERQYRTGSHLLHLINEILDFSKIESGRLDIKPSHCDVAQMMNSVYDQFSQACADKGLVLDILSEDGTMFADEFRTRQIHFQCC